MCGSFFFALVLFVSCVQDRAVTVDSLVLHNFFAFNVRAKPEHERRNENFKSAAYRNPQRGKELPPLMQSKWGAHLTTGHAFYPSSSWRVHPNLQKLYTSVQTLFI